MLKFKNLKLKARKCLLKINPKVLKFKIQHKNKIFLWNIEFSKIIETDKQKTQI